MRHGEQHLHLRKRIHQLHEKYPHPDAKIRLLDNVVMVVSLVNPLMTLPQLYEIWFLQNAAGISVFTWGMYTLLTIPMLWYCIVHRVKPLIVMNILWLIMNGLVTLGAIIY